MREDEMLIWVFIIYMVIGMVLLDQRNPNG
jgi:hypothetical protein